uniref:polysaccharide deacetylase family protein n=1 Tax=Marinobacterium profundum TaxID=1714300 RepID=UPI0008321D53|nr:polysaccharide deacetylase family protein [Marinobacterium profundum]
MLHRLLTLFSHPLTRNKLSILNYHQVLESPDPMRPWEPDRVKFDWQMALLRRHFQPLSLIEALDRLEADTLPDHAICVTLDDGYLNNLEVGVPILKRHQIPATVFVASGFSNGENMWNDRILELFANLKNERINLEAIGLAKPELGNIATRRSLANYTITQLKYLPIAERVQTVNTLYHANGNIPEQRKMMRPEEISQLAAAGVEIGGHTHHHPILKGMSPQEQHQEIQQNKMLLEQWTGKPVVGFAYPNGRFGKDMDGASLAVVRQLGFRYAVSTDAGYTHKASNPHNLSRFTPWDNQPLRFHARLISNLVSRLAARN